MNKHLFIFLCAFACPFLGFSQTIVKGKLTTSKGTPVAGAIISLRNCRTDNILNYKIADQQGNFSLSVQTEASEICLNVRSMGCQTIVKTLDNKSQDLHLVLEETSTEIKEVLIEFSPINRRGDTISYNVSSFSKQKDRSIADVIKHMPGLEVRNDGRILYQGKPINKYYIEGLDLLGGKYKIANEALPHKEVAEIQILENHQPLKILDGVEFSDKAALNVKLKKKHTWANQAEIGGGGYAPLLWQLALSPMLFTPKQQMILAYKTNNTGKNVASELKTLSIEDLIESFDNQQGRKDWLHIRNWQIPAFSEKRHLNNNVHLLNANFLQSLKKSYELRLNASYLNDYQQERENIKTRLFLPGDTVAFLEEIHNRLFFNSLETNLTLQKNTKGNFLKNSFQFQGFWDEKQGRILQNNSPLTQNLSNQYFRFSNRFKTVLSTGNLLWHIKSYAGIEKQPQTLQIAPGQFENLLMQGNHYSDILQQVDFQTIYTNNSASFTSAWKRFRFSPKIGFQFGKKNLLTAMAAEGTSLTGAEFSNSLDWLNFTPYADLKTQYQQGKWRLSFRSPLHFRYRRTTDTPLQRGELLRRFTFDPSLLLIFDADAFWSIQFSGNLYNRFGSIHNLHYAYILLNYRKINRTDAPLPQTKIQELSGRISYRNPIKALFWNLFYSFSRDKNNLLYKTEISDTGAAEVQAFSRENEVFRHSVSTRISKYISKLNTNLSLNAGAGRQEFLRLINETTTAVKSENWQLGGLLEIDFTDWLNMEYKAKCMWSKSTIDGSAQSVIRSQNHTLGIIIYPAKNQYITIDSEYMRNSLFGKNADFFFTDLAYHYTWEAKNIDFALHCRNILNMQEYALLHSADFSYTETSFSLRPREFLLSLRFSF